MKKFYIFILLIFMIFSCLNIFPQKNLPPVKTIERKIKKVNVNPMQSLINTGNVTSWVRDDGFHDWVVSKTWNGSFPNGLNIGTIFSEGIVWGGLVFDGNTPTVRVDGNTYGTGCYPKIRLYRVRPDYLNSDLTSDAASFNNVPISQLTEADIQILKDQYQTDWNEWPAEEGAPYSDINGDGMYDPFNDIPGVPGASQTLFIQYTDNDAMSIALYGSPSIGLEISETYWSYGGIGDLGNIIFKKVDIIYKGTSNSVPLSRIDSMYIAQWADPDVGNATDDFAGCDTTLNLGYVYNANITDQFYNSVGLKSPSVGYALLQGASKYTGNPSDSARFNLKWRKGYKYINRKPMSSFIYFASGGAWFDPDFNYNGTLEFYNLMRGKLPRPGYPSAYPFPDAVSNITPEGTYLLAGDPVAHTGKLDGSVEGPGDRRILAVNGPFSMNLGDTVEIVIAEINAMPANITDPNPNLSSVKKLKDNVTFANAIINGKIEAILSGPDLIEINKNIEYFMNFLPVSANVNSSTWILTNKPSGSNAQLTNVQINSATLKADVTGNYEIANISNVGGKTFTNFKTIKAVLGLIPGDNFYISHISGQSDGSIDVTVVDSSKLTGHNYEVFFTQRDEVRNSNGDWVAAGMGKLNKPTDLTGTTIDVSAIYSQNFGQVQLRFSLNLVSSTYAWADGITITFPAGVIILSAPSFVAGGGTIVPEVNGNIIKMGLTNGELTQNGIFHGGETWDVFISSPTLPLAVDWLVHDDGYIDASTPTGVVLDASGTFTLTTIGELSRTAKYWNVKDLTTGDIKLENQGVINNNNLFPPRDDLSTDLINNIPYYLLPVVDGFRVRVDGLYDSPKTFSEKNPPTVNGKEMTAGTRWISTNFILTNFIYFGYPDGTVNATLGAYVAGASGTTDIGQLQQDLELRWTGVLGDTVINGKTLKITKSGGSYITIFGASGWSIANHPLNPNPGSTAPFTVRVPFEVWNVESNQQINCLFWARSGNATVDNGVVWNTADRQYLWVVNTPYSNTPIDPASQVVKDHGTWNEVLYKSTFNQGDVLRINYENPITIGVDRFDFNTIATPVAENVEIINSFRLEQNYPNPFNPSTTIKFVIPKAGIVSLKIFDVLGQEVKTLINEYKNAGSYSLNFNADWLASGVYFYRLQTGFYVQIKKMILLR